LTLSRLSLLGIGLGPLRTEAPRLIGAGLSFSGGGVGGKTLRLFGGSDCCRLLCRPGLTRLLAANERDSDGLSSLTSAVDDLLEVSNAQETEVAWNANSPPCSARHRQSL
jgi:hypothetical protein